MNRTIRLRSLITGLILFGLTAFLMAQQPVNMLQFNGSAVALGQTTMSASIPVVLASNQASIPVTQGLATTGGYTRSHAVCAGSTNVANVKASAGQVYAIELYDNVNYPVYLKLYNTAGTPTAGTSVVETFGAQAGTGRFWPLVSGDAFATGIGVSVTKGITDADATATLASDCTYTIWYN
jgi:hypothetical protein